jgi:hypothetical protein
MTQFIKIETALSPATVALIKAVILEAHTDMDPIKITLTPSQTKALYKIGPIRESEIGMVVTKLMVAHPETITSSFTMAQFNALTQEGSDSYTLEAMFLALAAIAGAHGDIVQNDRFFWVLQCLDNARMLGKTNATIAEIVAEITTEFFTRAASAKKTASAYTIAPSATISIAGVTTNKYFTNNGTTILTFLKVGASVTELITVYPGSGAMIPLKWTKIVVTNISALAEGAFSLFVS